MDTVQCAAKLHCCRDTKMAGVDAEGGRGGWMREKENRATFTKRIRMTKQRMREKEKYISVRFQG